MLPCKLQWHKGNRSLDLAKSRLDFREAVLTTFLTIDRFGTRGNRGEDRFGKHGIRSGKRQKRTEKIRKKFLQFFGTRMPRVRVSPLGPKVQNPLCGVWTFLFV